MSDTSESLRRKIDGAVELESVVRTMKALAASSIAQYERAVISLDDYYRTVELGLIASQSQQGAVLHAEGSRRANRSIAVVFGSDQGLVGQFNEQLADYVVSGMKNRPAQVIAVGERVEGHLTDAGFHISTRFSVPNSITAITPLVGRILSEIEGGREEVSQIFLFHHRPRTGSAYEPVMQRLLPLDEAWRQGLSNTPWPTGNLPELIGRREATIEALIREYLFISLFRACAESLASENASRLVAMRRAEKNIDELLADLNQDFHRLRQNTIDEELFDVIAGYELLSSGRRPVEELTRSDKPWLRRS